MTGPLLEVRGLEVIYGEHLAIQDLDLTVAEGEVVSVVGPSGCGKTSLLRVVAGLLQSSEGAVQVLGRPVDGVPSDLAIVFQDYSRSLFPWLRVRGNVEFSLVGSGQRRSERRAAAEASLADVGLEQMADAYPWQLSGGMQQRVAIARALVSRPKLLLMDEPFASVDAQARADLEDLLLRLHAASGVTVVLVTHDIDESVYVADRVVVMSRSPGRVEEELNVELPRPRDQVLTRAHPGFVELRSHVARLIAGA